MWWKIVMTLKFSKFLSECNKRVHVSKKKKKRDMKAIKEKTTLNFKHSLWFWLKWKVFWIECVIFAVPKWRRLLKAILSIENEHITKNRLHIWSISFPFACNHIQTNCVLSSIVILSLGCVVVVVSNSFFSSSKWAHCFDYLHSS